MKESDSKRKLKRLINAIFTEEEKKEIHAKLLERKDQIIADTQKAMQDFTEALKSNIKKNE